MRNQTLEIKMRDGQTQASWSCDEGVIKHNIEHYVSVIVDADLILLLIVN